MQNSELRNSIFYLSVANSFKRQYFNAYKKNITPTPNWELDETF